MPTIDSLIGARLGNYAIESRLGRGGMGVVYKAMDTALQRPAAIKVLSETLSADEASVKRFTREARSVARLNHPNIVTVYGVGRKDDIFYIAMEFVDGRSLHQLLQAEGKLGLRTALEFTLQATYGLTEAEAQGIVHRDIKPANIMVTHKGKVKLMDFGLAQAGFDSSRLTATEQVVGTPAYMSPEQCMGATVDTRSDIYALGVSLFAMLTGDAPFRSSSLLGLMRKIVDEETPLLSQVVPGVPKRVNDIVARMMAKKPEHRYQTAAELCAELEGYLGAKPGPVVLEDTLPPKPAPKPDEAFPKSPDAELDKRTKKEAAEKAEAERKDAARQEALAKAAFEENRKRRKGILFGVGALIVVALAGLVVSRPNASGGGFAPPLFPRSDFMWIEPGTFSMGSPITEPGRDDSEILHTVTLTRGFWLSKYEVTQSQWEAVMGSNPSLFKGEDLPVHMVSWEEVQRFIATLNDWHGTDFRLPTEAEWEYACRAGSDGPMGGMEYLDAYGWYVANSATMVHPVGQKTSNAWGLHDMLGNVREYCADWVGPYDLSQITDPTGPRMGSDKVHRGGGWAASAAQSRAAARSKQPPHMGASDLGFRLAR